MGFIVVPNTKEVLERPWGYVIMSRHRKLMHCNKYMNGSISPIRNNYNEVSIFKKQPEDCKLYDLIFVGKWLKTRGYNNNTLALLCAYNTPLSSISFLRDIRCKFVSAVQSSARSNTSYVAILRSCHFNVIHNENIYLIWLGSTPLLREVSILEWLWTRNKRRNPPKLGCWLVPSERSFFNKQTKLKTENRGEQCISFSVKNSREHQKWGSSPYPSSIQHMRCCLLLSMEESFSVENEKKSLLPETNNMRWESNRASTGPDFISPERSYRNILQLASEIWKHQQYLHQLISQQLTKCMPSIKRYLDRCL